MIRDFQEWFVKGFMRWLYWLADLLEIETVDGLEKLLAGVFIIILFVIIWDIYREFNPSTKKVLDRFFRKNPE